MTDKSGEFPTRTESDRFSAKHSPLDRDTYVREKVVEVSKSNRIWFVRNIDADYGRVYDLYADSVPVGFVDHDDLGFYSAYVFDAEADTVTEVHSGDSLIEATLAVEKSIS